MKMPVHQWREAHYFPTSGPSDSVVQLGGGFSTERPLLLLSPGKLPSERTQSPWAWGGGEWGRSEVLLMSVCNRHKFGFHLDNRSEQAVFANSVSWGLCSAR